jgi:uncharacterized protein YutE (UPF0331/DUF86 family)
MSNPPARNIRTDIIRIKLVEIRDSVGIVRDNLPDKLEGFLQLGLIRDGIYKKIEHAIENVLDICAVLNSDLMLGVPGEDEDILLHLQAHGIISLELAGKIRGMKAFRNIMVHRYGAIDDTIAYRLLNEHLGDFDLFQAEIEEFLES